MEAPLDPVRIAIVGGGAAGIFAAISAREANPNVKVCVFEKSNRFLTKVKISGGGRCNVTHACFEPRELTSRYPRGSKELLGPFYSWQPQDTVDWFESHGVALKTEPDGRMFPVTDSSQTIIDCLLDTARGSGVALKAKTGVDSARIDRAGKFQLSTNEDLVLEFDRLVLATGGGQNSPGHRIAESFGHTISSLAPSLFTFHISDARIDGLQGLSVPNAVVTCPSIKLSQSGPLLITHWGLSGPSILKLSAWGAHQFAEFEYTFKLQVNWTGTHDLESAKQVLMDAKRQHGAKQVGTNPLLGLPRRLWDRFLDTESIDPKMKLSQVANHQLLSLSTTCVACDFQVTGKSMNKEEFVTCGGVSLHEIEFKRMESKQVPKLYFAGETLDIDGVTGGFNFQAAWTTGRIAGTSAAI